MRFILIGGLGLAVAAPGVAQGPAPSGVVRGVVYDSLITSRPLEGAEVWIESTNRMARSDASGRFVLTALTPGRYVQHGSRPMTNLLLSMANIMGAQKLENFGDSTGRLGDV